MKIKTSNLILLFTAVFSALMAGLFYSYSCSVMLGLGKLQDIAFIKAMQLINREIQNPLFFTCFFGILLLLPLSTWLSFQRPLTLQCWLLLIATVVYFTGVLGVTIFGNVPLNNSLEQFNLVNATEETIHHQRAMFEEKWNALNTIRTVSSLATIILVIIACIYRNKASLPSAGI
jgi:uncharacterized membrane protein